MDPRTRARYRARAAVVKAMAHPTRLLIVDELAKRERCVNELTRLVGDDVSTVSKHLSVLRNAGILEDEKRGMQVYYRLRARCILNFFSCVEGVLAAGKPRRAR
jgi:DNA-binding transcriptional ArsR family regulator